MQHIASSRCDTLSFTVLGCHVVIQCSDAEAYALLQANYGGLQRESRDAAELRYTVGRQAGSQAFLLRRAGETPRRAADAGALLFMVEKDCTIALQILRPDLYFVHAAVLEWAGSAVMLVAASGEGKSTTTWALLHHGFRYCSDELGPVDVQTCEVYPYPHALCLKEEPPAAYPLPTQTLCTPSTLHIPTAALPSEICTGPIRLAAIFFVQYRPKAAGPTVRLMHTAEAAARLFAHALNPLAHAEEGLDGAVATATRCPCFALHTADLPATCALMVRTLHDQFQSAQNGNVCTTPQI
jgi:hypothetical protein